MTRVVDPFRFYARAALTDWSHINRARDPNDLAWQREWARRRLDGTSMAQLRWSINPHLHPLLSQLDYGMPSGPFTVWARMPSEKSMREIKTVNYQGQEGATVIWWIGEPLVYVVVTVVVSGNSANLAALNGPLALDTLESIQTAHNGTSQIVLSGTSISSVVIHSDGPVSVLKVIGITAREYANSDEWKPIEIVGLPVDQNAWADVERHSEKQGMVGALTTPVEAAHDRLRRGAAPFGWAATLGPNPAPQWELPDFDALIKEVQHDALPRLHPVMKLAPVLQARQRDWIDIPGPTGSGGTLSDPSYAELPPLGLTLVASGSDPLLALTLGFGTAYQSAPFASVPGTSFSLLVNRRIFDYMVTATWDRGMDGKSAPLEMAALAIGAAPPVRPLLPSTMEAKVQARNRPHKPDQPWTSAARVLWDRLPRIKMLTTSSFALARANPATPAAAASAIMRVRPSGGYAPITLTRNPKDKESARHSGVDDSLVLPMTNAGLAVRYGVALQDIWGLWSAWGTVNYNDQQPALERPRILKCALDASVPAAGRVCDGVLTVELAWDWEVRRPRHIELRCRLFAAPKRSETAPPDLSLPAGLQMQLGADEGDPLIIAFSGDSVAPPLAGVVVDYYDVEGNPITPGPAGSDDVRRYRITISGFKLDYNSVGHVGVALWSLVQERAAPLRMSDWLAPQVIKSNIKPGPNIAYASDPIPPVPGPPEIVKRASLADARGEHHARVSWGTSPGAVGYFIYTATESAILGAQAKASRPAPDPTHTFTDRLAVLRGLLEKDTHRNSFARVNTKAQTETSADLVLPRGTKEIHLFTMVAVNAGNIESAWPTEDESETRFLAIAAAGIVTPAAPLLEIRREERPAGDPKFAVRVQLTSQPGARVQRYELFRTRVEAAAMNLDTMGPPVATIVNNGAGWSVEMNDKDANAVQEAVGTDAPDGSWKKVWYRAVAWAHADDDRALLAGRSPPSNAMSVVIPPDGLPDLSDLAAEWAGGPLNNLLVKFGSSAPIAVTALGPHKLSVNVQVIDGQSKTASKAQLLLEDVTLDAIGTAAPPATGLWRSSAATAKPSQYVLRLNRGSVDDRLAIVVCMTDPLGRSTEKVLNIQAGPVDPMPDVLDLEMHAAGVDVVNATWRSSAPLGVRAGGKYTIKVIITGPKKPILQPIPPIVLPLPPVLPLPGLPVLPIKGKSRGAAALKEHADASVAAIMSKQGVAEAQGKADPKLDPKLDPKFDPKFDPKQPGGGLRDPVFTLPAPTTTIDMALGDVPLAGKAPPAMPWQLVRQNGVNGVTSYGLTFNGKAVSVKVRITAPDGRFAEVVAK